MNVVSKANLLQVKAGKTVFAVALAIAFAAFMLVGCAGQSASSGSSAASSSTASSASASASASASGASASAAAQDIAQWKTLGDALVNAKSMLGTASDETHYICVYDTNDGSYFRVVAKMTPSIDEAIGKLDFFAEDHDQQLFKAIGDLEILEAQDITGELLSQDELDAYIGKTGQEIFDAGFEFRRYYLFGGDQTGVSVDKGPFSYGIVFDVSVPDDVDDAGASVNDAKATELTHMSVADSALNPTLIA